MSTTQNKPTTVGAVPETATEFAAGFTARVLTEGSDYEPGVSVRFHFSARPEDVLSNDSRAFVGFHLNLTPDDADNLAAALVAHAWDRRRMDDARAEAEGVQA